MKNILVAIDFSEVTDKLLTIAEKQAKAFDAKLWLVHVAAPDPDFVGYEVGPQHEREHRAKTLHKEHATLQEMSDRLAKKDCKTEALLVQGATIDILKEEIENLNIDLLVMGSHGYGFLKKLLWGSVSQSLLQEITTPMLLVPFEK